MNGGWKACCFSRQSYAPPDEALRLRFEGCPPSFFLERSANREGIYEN